MMKIFLANAFSINMIPSALNHQVSVFFRPLSPKQAWEMLEEGFVPAIGHEDTANLVQADLGLPESPFARISVAAHPGDFIVVGQYVGPRLPEGATSLPEGASIRYFLVEIGGFAS